MQTHLNPFSVADGLKSMVDAITSIYPMSPGDIALLVPHLRAVTTQKTELVLCEGQVCQHIFFLCSGLSRMYYVDEAGNQINYRFTQSGHFFVDFQSFLTQIPSRFYWETMRPSKLLVVNYATVQQLYQTSPAWNEFGRLMAERVYLQLNERVDMLLFMKPEERYTYWMSTNPGLRQSVSLFHLSTYLGIQPESLSRIRKRLAKK